MVALLALLLAAAPPTTCNDYARDVGVERLHEWDDNLCRFDCAREIESYMDKHEYHSTGYASSPAERDASSRRLAQCILGQEERSSKVLIDEFNRETQETAAAARQAILDAEVAKQDDCLFWLLATYGSFIDPTKFLANGDLCWWAATGSTNEVRVCEHLNGGITVNWTARYKKPRKRRSLIEVCSPVWEDLCEVRSTTRLITEDTGTWPGDKPVKQVIQGLRQNGWAWPFKARRRVSTEGAPCAMQYQAP